MHSFQDFFGTLKIILLGGRGVVLRSGSRENADGKARLAYFDIDDNKDNEYEEEDENNEDDNDNEDKNEDKDEFEDNKEKK